MYNYYVGIDPGLSGALAVLDHDGNLMAVFETPTTVVKSGKKNRTEYIVSGMVNIINQVTFQGTVFGIERQQAMPGQGVSSMMKIGYGYGLWIGLIAMTGQPYHIITPQAWKKEMMVGMGKEKAASCVKAQQLFPHGNFFTQRGRAIDGNADATLIALYLKQQST